MMVFKVKGKQHKVKLSRGFCLGKYEVTQAQGGRVAGNRRTLPGDGRPLQAVGRLADRRTAARRLNTRGRPICPCAAAAPAPTRP